MDNNQQMNKKEQEQQSAEKLGKTASRGAFDYATGGQWEKVRNAPVVGKIAQKAEDKTAKKFAKSPGGKATKKLAKKLDDAGVVDGVNKGLNAFGGSKAKSSPSSNPNINRANNAFPNHSSVDNNPNIPRKNFAKNGLTDEGQEIPGLDNKEGSMRKSFDDIQKRRESSNSSDYSEKSSKRKKIFNNPFKNDNDQNVIISAEVISLMKKTILPFVGIVIFLIILLGAADTFNKDNDLSVVDDDIEEGEKGSTSYYANNNPKLQKFYDNVISTKDSYSEDGKSINAMYITATFHILREYNTDVTLEDMTQSEINKLADGMLGGSTVYSEDTYRKFLTDEYFPQYISDARVDGAVDRVFEYIEQYMNRVHPKTSGCSTVTGGSCQYSLKGVHGYNSDPLNISNLQVRLMSSSFCGGTDGKALDEDLVPFENYVLGVTYGEIDASFNPETEKAHMIAARSFALARPITFHTSGVGYVTEGGQNIVQLRSCVADQVYCNPELGCSKDVDARNQYGVVYSGATTHAHTYKEPLSTRTNSTLRSSWQETLGMVGVDKDGKIVEMGYSGGNGNKDDNVWERWAKSGMDYVQIILKAYPEITEIKKMNCSSTSESTDSAFLQVAAKIWKQVANGGYSYKLSGVSVPPTNNLIDCSSFVSWVLYEYGFKDEFGGGQHNTVVFANTDWTSKMGWQEISVTAGEDVTSKLQPGDILVRDAGGGANGHINIIAEVSDGKVLAYDCGSESNWNNSTAKAGKPIDRTSFAKSDNRAGKIIRVSNVGGSSCQSAESGEALSWKQYCPAAWCNVPLGNSGATIGGYGCFITSIAIQIARSGTTTTLSEFNPGTFVKELNKYGSFDGSGSFVGAANIPKIAPAFSEKYHGVSLTGSAKDKISVIKGYLDQGLYPIMRVKTTNGQHWVAVVGVTDDDVIMADPGSEKTNAFATYSLGECSTLNVYQIG